MRPQHNGDAILGSPYADLSCHKSSELWPLAQLTTVRVRVATAEPASPDTAVLLRRVTLAAGNKPSAVCAVTRDPLLLSLLSKPNGSPQPCRKHRAQTEWVKLLARTTPAQEVILWEPCGAPRNGGKWAGKRGALKCLQTCCWG